MRNLSFYSSAAMRCIHALDIDQVGSSVPT